ALDQVRGAHVDPVPGSLRWARDAFRSSVKHATAEGWAAPKRSIREAAMASPASSVGASRTALAWARTSSTASGGSLARMLAMRWNQQRIRRLDPKTWAIALISPGAPSEVTEVGARSPRETMSLQERSPARPRTPWPP